MSCLYSPYTPQFPAGLQDWIIIKLLITLVALSRFYAMGHSDMPSISPFSKGTVVPATESAALGVSISLQLSTSARTTYLDDFIIQFLLQSGRFSQFSIYTHLYFMSLLLFLFFECPSFLSSKSYLFLRPN